MKNNYLMNLIGIVNISIYVLFLLTLTQELLRCFFSLKGTQDKKHSNGGNEGIRKYLKVIVKM